MSPKTPTAPPFGFTSACVANEASSSWKAPLWQLMLTTTGRRLPLVSALTSVVVNLGDHHWSGNPWSRWTMRYLPSFHAAVMSAVPPFQANVGFLSSAGRSVP